MSNLQGTIMSDVEKAIRILIKTFRKYANKEAYPCTINKAKVKEVLINEFGAFVGNAKDKAVIDSVFDELDENNDNSVDFSEFVSYVGKFAVFCEMFDA